MSPSQSLALSITCRAGRDTEQLTHPSHQISLGPAAFLWSFNSP